jgi:hypothetical protein
MVEKAGLPSFDFMNIKAIPELMAELTKGILTTFNSSEQLIYSNRVKKFNRFDWT